MVTHLTLLVREASMTARATEEQAQVATHNASGDAMQGETAASMRDKGIIAERLVAKHG